VSELSDGLIGYAQFPEDFAKKPSTDGVVIKTTAFGRVGNIAAPYNAGRTATHEVGHWLNLRHIWGDDGGACNGTDYCDDTPNQGNRHIGCPGFPTVSCSNGPNGDMFMNYMDYTDDRCMNLFTNDQRIRMRAMFASGGPREAMVYSTFNIDPLYTAVCSNATVQLANPACLTGVNWSITGPAAIAGAGNSAVVTRTGNLNGIATVTAASGNYTESRDIVIGTGANLVNFTQKQITCVAGKPYFYGAVADIPYSGFTYSWYSKDESNPNNPFILRQTGTENTADFPLGNNRGNRYYTIRVSATNTCGTIQTVNEDGYLYAPACTGSTLRPVVSAFPNPAMAEVAISIEPGEPAAAAYMYTLELVDKMGTVLDRKSYHPGVKTVTVSINKLSPGFYIARVWTGEEWLSLQVIKK
jgi:hypothetical protein